MTELIGEAGMGAGIGAALAVIAAGIGIGTIGVSMCSAISKTKDPKVRKEIISTGLVGSALIEGICLFAIVVAMLIGSSISQ